MAATNLRNTVWVLKPSINIDNISGTFDINFKSNEMQFSQIIFDFENSYTWFIGSSEQTTYFKGMGYGNVTVGVDKIAANHNAVALYQNDEWHWNSNLAFRTIEITDGEDATNANLIAWFKANANEMEFEGNVLVNKTFLENGLSDICDKIREKTGDTATLSFPNGIVSAIDGISGGGGATPSTGVFFLDYDGSVVEAWEPASVSSKTALPNNPQHEGLTAQGWNWTLQNIKDYISNYPEANVYVKQMYKTSSGLSEFDITVTKVTGLTVTFKMSGTKNWGDGTSDTSTSHTYTDYGDYTITCDGTSIPAGTSSSSGLFGSSNSNINRYWCTAARLGEYVTSIGSYAFCYCYSLTNIIISNGVTSIGSYAFGYCYSLTNATIPNSVTRIDTFAFTSCYSLTSVTIPNGVTSIMENAFASCHSLTNITIPNSVTSIGKNAFTNCYGQTNITIPNSVTSISNNAFAYCYGITNITIPNSVTSIGNAVFSYCNNLTNATISNGVTSISDQIFQSCVTLTNITIPDGVTSIGTKAFYACYSLTNITIPNSVTSISANVFSSCYSILKYDFSNATAIPTLENTNAFSNINGLCKIIVPDALYDNWKAATNWSTYANYIYKASEVTEQ